METTEIRPGVELNHHNGSLCAGQPCPIHNPTDHPLRSYPLDWDSERGVMVRLMPTGQKVIDPDEYLLRVGGILRNSMLCLDCGTHLVSRHRHDWVSCPCGNFVDGGRDYLRRTLGNVRDTSLTVKDGVLHGDW